MPALLAADEVPDRRRRVREPREPGVGQRPRSGVRVNLTRLSLLQPSSGVEIGTTTITLGEPVSIGELTICLGSEQNRSGWFRTLRNLNPRMSGNDRIDAGEKLRMPSMLVPSYMEQCAGASRLLAHDRELHDATDDKLGGLEQALQDSDT
jgi:hypothetical protein